MLNAIVLVSAEIKEIYSIPLVVSMFINMVDPFHEYIWTEHLIEEKKKLYENQKPHTSHSTVLRNDHYTATRYWYRMPTNYNKHIQLMCRGMPYLQARSPE